MLESFYLRNEARWGIKGRVRRRKGVSANNCWKWQADSTLFVFLDLSAFIYNVVALRIDFIQRWTVDVAVAAIAAVAAAVAVLPFWLMLLWFAVAVVRWLAGTWACFPSLPERSHISLYLFMFSTLKNWLLLIFVHLSFSFFFFFFSLLFLLFLPRLHFLKKIACTVSLLNWSVFLLRGWFYYQLFHFFFVLRADCWNMCYISFCYMI